MKSGWMIAVGLMAVSVYGYPQRYLAETNTVEQRTALIKELWAHDPAADHAVWPEGKIPLKKSDKPMRNMEHELWQRNLVVTDVNVPTFTFFPAKGVENAPVVVILPGGGYFQLGWNKEGTEIADWLNANGISAALLLYRAPGQRDAALCDTQRTIRILRSRAKAFNINPSKIGVIGFSAGANLAVRSATNWRTSLYERIDAIDDLSARPDFQVIVYPWDLCPRNLRKDNLPLDLKPDYPVDQQTPPAFIIQAQDDFCMIETSIALYLALQKQRIPSELHVYPFGGHGYGLRRLGTPVDSWSDLAAQWIKAVCR
ncbi:MAG: alpha/beta hydrolase [Kiritimatiellae bacterium]|nr:alpha/beta hydrolase [Kiritimatiellia bacterium]